MLSRNGPMSMWGDGPAYDLMEQRMEEAQDYAEMGLQMGSKARLCNRADMGEKTGNIEAMRIGNISLKKLGMEFAKMLCADCLKYRYS